MNRFLLLAEYLFGNETRQRVFDPLVADAHSEIARSRMPALARVRWQCAMIVALVVSAPRAILIPRSLAVDLVIRAAAFGSFAFVVELFASPWRRSVPPSFLSILPFVIMPLAWRVRVSLVPHHQRRLVAVVIGLIGAALTAATAPAELSARIAFSVAPVIAVLIGWHTGAPEYEKKIQPHANSIVMRGMMIGGALQAFIWLPLVIAGGLQADSYLPAVSIYAYPIGCAISASIVKRWHVDSQPQE